MDIWNFEIIDNLKNIKLIVTGINVELYLY